MEASSRRHGVYAEGPARRRTGSLRSPGYPEPRPPASSGPAGAPPPPPAPSAAELAAASLDASTPEPEVRRPARPGTVSARSSGIDRPTSMSPSVPLPEPEQPPENLRGRVVERPAPPKYVDPVPTGAPTATYQPEVVMEMQQRVPPFGPAPTRETAAAANLPYAAGDRFEYRHEVGELIKRGDKLKAVNLLRAKTGASLVEALKQVESWG